MQLKQLDVIDSKPTALRDGKELVVISGKGGTGKTTVAASLVILAADSFAVDADVDASNLPILFDLSSTESSDFYGLQYPRIDPDICDGCGTCVEVCRFDAIRIDDGEIVPTIDLFSCEGCGACATLCPQEAIAMEDHVAGKIFVSKFSNRDIVHAALNIGEETSGKLVTKVRERARSLLTAKHSLTIVDGSPGVGCPVIASLTGSSLALAVTEPTISGLSDLRRIIQLCKQLNVPVTVCVNKHDINPEMTENIQSHCESEEITFLGTIPYDEAVTEAMARTRPVVRFAPDSGASKAIVRIWASMKNLL